VFPHVGLWTTEVHEMMLIGSMEPLRLDFSRISRRFQTPDIASTLVQIGVTTPADWLATWVTNRKGLEAYVGNALPVTDDRPRIENAKWVRAQQLTLVLPDLLDLRQPPPVVAYAAEKARIKTSHQQLVDFYDISMLATVVDREASAAETMATMIREFRQTAEPNAYHDWFFGR